MSERPGRSWGFWTEAKLGMLRAYLPPFLECLAAHKKGYKKPGSGGPEYKVELWLLFPTPGLIRTLALDDAKMLPEHELGATRLFGTNEWQAIYERRRRGALTAADAKEEYVNLMRWRLTHDLGYAKTHPFELRNTKRGTMYHMIFATDNAAGDRIMADIYRSAAATQPAMRQEAIDRQRHQTTLPLEDVEFTSATYQHEPPWQPPQ